MIETPPNRILEVTVVQRGPHSWEWRTHTGDRVHVYGNEKTRVAARLAAYDMYFTMLAGGWD